MVTDLVPKIGAYSAEKMRELIKLDTVSSIFSVAIYEGTTEAVANGTVAGEEGEGSHVGSVELEKSVLGIVQAVARGGEREAGGQADSTQSTGKVNPQSPGGQRGTVYELWQMS